MPRHSSGPQQPLLHGGTHHSPYGGLNNHHHHNRNQHPHHIHPSHHHPHHHHAHYSHHDFHHGYRRRWYHPWISFNFRSAPVMQPSLPHTHTDVVIVERPRFHVLKAIIYTVVIWLLLGALIRSLTTDWIWGYKYELESSRQWAIALGNASFKDYPIPSGIDLTSCENPLENGGSSSVSFQIPSSSDAHLLFADGPWIYGTVQVTTTSAETDFVRYTVSLSSRHERPADTIVCSLTREHGEKGVGIFNPKGARRDVDDAIRYDVTVEFPENHPVVKRFESDVINSSHNIDDLQGKILFEALSLHGSNGGIHSKSVSAQWADITTVNGPIDGNYNATDFLKIHTVNGRIEVDVDFNQDASDKAVLSLFTSNSPIKANLRLHDATSSRSTAANFEVTAETANSPLNIVFLDAPVDSTLSVQALTAVSPAEVTLHPTFEGHFSLSSTWFSPVVHKRPEIDDPSGRGRHRFVSYRNIRGNVDGDVAWGEGPKDNAGRVEVSSSISRVTLNL